MVTSTPEKLSVWLPQQDAGWRDHRWTLCGELNLSLWSVLWCLSETPGAVGLPSGTHIYHLMLSCWPRLIVQALHCRIGALLKQYGITPAANRAYHQMVAAGIVRAAQRYHTRLTASKILVADAAKATHMAGVSPVHKSAQTRCAFLLRIPNSLSSLPRYRSLMR